MGTKYAIAVYRSFQLSVGSVGSVGSITVDNCCALVRKSAIALKYINPIDYMRDEKTKSP
ncbi:MAG: hypothetical protein AB4057_19225 [Crocosphaera sp.]